jgi:hypothetical protein
MPTFVINNDAPVLVEFAPRPGVQQVALTPADMAEKSEKALDSAMNTIHQMAGRVSAALDTLAEHRPNEVEVEFGLKLDAEAGALIAKAGIEASVNVKLTWKGGDAKP